MHIIGSRLSKLSSSTASGIIVVSQVQNHLNSFKVSLCVDIKLEIVAGKDILRRTLLPTSKKAVASQLQKRVLPIEVLANFWLSKKTQKYKTKTFISLFLFRKKVFYDGLYSVFIPISLIFSVTPFTIHSMTLLGPVKS